MNLYSVYLPCPALRPFISHYDLVRAAPDLRSSLIPPQLSSGFSFCEFLNAPLTVSNKALQPKVLPDSFIIPVHTRGYAVEFNQLSWALGVHFLPGKFFEFFGWPQYPFREEVAVMPEDTDLGKDFAELKEQVFESRDDARKIALAETFLLRHFPRKTPFLPAMDYILQKMIQAGGLASLPDLRWKTGLSERHFRRLFLEHTGIPASTFLRILRFYRAFELLKSAHAPVLQDIAFEAGYFDQAHFIRDFKEYTGLPPHEFLKLQPSLPDDLAWKSPQNGR